eukprot:jgi/Mesen1/1926/ME000146S01011
MEKVGALCIRQPGRMVSFSFFPAVHAQRSVGKVVYMYSNIRKAQYGMEGRAISKQASQWSCGRSKSQGMVPYGKPLSLGRGGVHTGASSSVEPVVEASAAPGSGSEESEEPPDWEVKMLYDGECPLCMREVNMLRERNKTYGTIKFVDICADNYSAEANAGIDFEEAMGRIHGIERNGTVLTNIAAFRKFYDVVGLGWVYAATTNPIIGSMADAVYDFWAKYRLPVTGRPPIAAILEQRRKKQEARSDDSASRCKS